MNYTNLPPLTHISRISNQVIWKGCGYSDDDMGRPIIGIANSFSDMVPGHTPLRQIAEQVKHGVYRAGGTPAEFGVIACCDGLGGGHNGNNYTLPSRDVIADSVEIIAEAHRLDGLVLLGSCDKIVPGMLMAAARLDIPCIFVPAGAMMSGPGYAEEKSSDTTSCSEAMGRVLAGRMEEGDVRRMAALTAPTCGSCQFMGTANSMCCIAEALGMCLPGGALIPAFFNERLRSALQSGERIVHMVKAGLTARKILTRESIRNAIMLMMAVGGSSNAVIHLCALAHELGLDTADILRDFDELSEKIPLLAKINPATHDYDAMDLYYAGGVPEVLKRIADKLYGEAMTVTGKTLSENLEEYENPYVCRNDLIRDVDHPYSTLGGLAILRGNLCPDTAVSKPAAIQPEVRRFTGAAMCFDSEDECVEAIEAGRITPGTVVVIRYEGPRGGPGMKELYKPMKMLYGLGLAKSTALITDGRFSGTNSGCFVGHISPEAAAGGPLALVEDGDSITIDVTAAEELGAELEKKSVWYFDSPVSGGTVGAENGTLTIMVGGNEEVLNQALMPVYQAMGRNILYFGPNGSALKIKLINQILTWVNHAVICEAAVLAKKAGLDLDKMYDCLLNSFGYSRVLEVTFKSHIQPENYSNTTGMKMMVKDLQLARKFAEACGAVLPMTDAAMALYDKAIEDGYGEMDQCVIMEQLK